MTIIFNRRGFTTIADLDSAFQSLKELSDSMVSAIKQSKASR